MDSSNASHVKASSGSNLAKIGDFDYPELSGIYYVKSKKVNISSSGGVRTITPGIKLATVK